VRGVRPRPSRPRPRAAVAVAVCLVSPLWRVPGLKPVQIVRRAAVAALAEGRPLPVRRSQLVVALADDALVRDLNRRYRGRDRATNVLSFAASPPPATLATGTPLPLGDVVLAFETVAGEARSRGKALAHHLSHLVVHGVLHLIGYDHARAGEAQAMERLEASVLAKLGLDDPYAASPGARRGRTPAP
jgi:probable rRNA maturation factor